MSNLTTTSKRVTITAAPVMGETIIGYEIRRSADGVSGFVTAAMQGKFAPSEIPAEITTTPNKWVHPSGTYLGNSAYTTIQAAFDSLNPGDHLGIAGFTTGERAVLTRSGTEGSRIIIRCADYSNRPTIDINYSTAASAVPGWSSPYLPGMYCALGIQAEYVTVDGINIRRSPHTGIAVGDLVNNGSFTFNPTTFYRSVKIIRCDVQGTGSASWRTINADDCVFLGCVSLDSERNADTPYSTGGSFTWGSAISLMGKRISMIECEVGNSNGEGIHAGIHIRFGGGDGYAHIQVHKLILRRNKVYNTWSGPIYISNVDADADDPSIVEGNIVWHSDEPRYYYGGVGGYPMYGIGIGSESPRNDGTTAYGTNFFAGARNLIVRNNVVTGALRPFTLATEEGQDTTNVWIYNNTFYQTVPGSAPGVATVIDSYDNGQSNIYCKNNLVTDTVPERGCRVWEAPAGIWERGSNLFPQTPPPALDVPSNVIAANPGMVNRTYRPTGLYPAQSFFDTGQIHLTSASPAVNRGEIVPQVTDDIYGNPRPTSSGKYDIGAHSLSMPGDIFFDELSLPASTLQYYQVRFLQSNGAYSPWSAVDSA